MENPRSFARPPVPDVSEIQDVYLIGICGTGMGALAGLFQQAGKDVRGSDAAAYPPMSTHLAQHGIPVLEGYDAAHLDPPPDLTIVGNACRPDHEEAAYAREKRLVQQSFPEALAHNFLTDVRRPLVVAGTHGKTSTTGLLIHLLQTAGLDPGYLVGGVMQEQDTSYHLGTDAPFVVEGDEYDSAYFDKRPKFMHYRPRRAVVTSMEFDHADIYADWDAYRDAFASFVSLLPATDDATLALCMDDPNVAALAEYARAPVRTYGLSEDADVTARQVERMPDGQRFALVVDGDALGTMDFAMHGRHNLQNALGASVLALAEGVTPDALVEGLATFPGMKRRQEVRSTPGDVLLLDDFAHHPTAVAATLQATRSRYPDRRIVAVFEPRSNTSRRALFQEAYGTAFDNADAVFLKAPPVRHNDDPDAMLDADAVVQTISERGTPAAAYPDVDTLLNALVDALDTGDVALIMSNGSFGGLHERLETALT